MVTATLTAPPVWAGVTAAIEVLLTTVTPVAAVPPRVTVAPARKPAPVMVIAVPPAVVPEVGEIELKVGAGLLEEFGAGNRVMAATEGTPLLSTIKSM